MANLQGPAESGFAGCIARPRRSLKLFRATEKSESGSSDFAFVAFARFNPAFAVEGQVFALFVIVMAAAEAAIALAIVLNFYNNHLTVDVDTAEELKG